ncbi:hypothetical protein COCNU_contig68102494G000010 [Cocos nucifera]|nr:hypothetical protein [Cocos nucifera]
MALAAHHLIRYPPPLSSKAGRSLDLSSTPSFFAKAQVRRLFTRLFPSIGSD